MITKAMVLAAGLGKRMRPLTDTLPKPLVSVAGRPLIDHVLDWLGASGVSDAVVNTHYKAEMLESHLAARRKPVVHISREETLLETGGGIKKALPLIGGQPFFTANSDALTIDGPTPALRRLAAHWSDGDMDALLLVHRTEDAIGYEGPGDFFLGQDGTLSRRQGEGRAPYVYTGVQVLHPRLFEGAPEGPFSLNILYNRAMEQGARVRALPHDGYWLHVGDPDGLKKAETFLAA